LNMDDAFFEWMVASYRDRNGLSREIL